MYECGDDDTCDIIDIHDIDGAADGARCAPIRPSSHRARRVAKPRETSSREFALVVSSIGGARLGHRRRRRGARSGDTIPTRTPNTREQTLGSTLDSRRETSRDGVAENGEKRECVCIRINRARGRSDRGGGVGGVHAHGRLEGAAPGVHAERAGVERIRQVSGSLDARAPAIQSVR